MIIFFKIALVLCYRILIYVYIWTIKVTSKKDNSYCIFRSFLPLRSMIFLFVVRYTAICYLFNRYSYFEWLCFCVLPRQHLLSFYLYLKQIIIVCFTSYRKHLVSCFLYFQHVFIVLYTAFTQQLVFCFSLHRVFNHPVSVTLTSNNNILDIFHQHLLFCTLHF